jgi:hypothetical protein
MKPIVDFRIEGALNGHLFKGRVAGINEDVVLGRDDRTGHAKGQRPLGLDPPVSNLSNGVWGWRLTPILRKLLSP